MFSFKEKILIVIIFIFLPFLTNAKIYEEDIVATITPNNPGPNQSITVSIKTFATNIDQTRVIWTVNGKEVGRGVGLKEITATTGQIGSSLNITASLTSPEDGSIVSKTISITPSTVDLVWQSNGYVPPFYKGKALFPHQGQIVITAIPTMTDRKGNRISANNLIYKWKNDGTVLGSLSGYGKKTLTMNGNVISEPLLIEVEVTSQDGQIKGAGNTTIEPIEPTITLYRKSSTLGVLLENAILNSFNMKDKEVEIMAVPYNFSTTVKNGNNLEYFWSMNNTLIDGKNPSKIFRISDNNPGSTNIVVRITNSQKILQFSNARTTLLYNQK